MSVAVLVNVILDIAIVFAILAVLGRGMRAQVALMKVGGVERRRVRDRRRVSRPVSAHADDRRRGERRTGRPLTA